MTWFGRKGFSEDIIPVSGLTVNGERSLCDIPVIQNPLCTLLK